jgi:hypothetical protein
MKEKFLVAACAVSILASAAALAGSAAVRARAAEPAQPVADSGLTIVAENNETRVYSFRSEGHLCFAASTRGGSGISLQCPH